MYYYVNITSGMKSNGSFTKDVSLWMTFSEEEKCRIEALNTKPYGATKQGIFILAALAFNKSNKA